MLNQNEEGERQGMEDAKIIEWLRALCGAPGVSGAEDCAAAEAEKLLKNSVPGAKADVFDNVSGVKKSAKAGAKTFLLDAHIDEIGMIVTSIDAKGFLRVSNCGGVDRRLLAAQAVTVHGRKPLFGVVGTKPPHLMTADEAKKVGKMEEMFVDIGLCKEEAERLVSPGDRITMHAPLEEMYGGLVCGKALDDRAGVAAILYALELLGEEDPGINVAVQFTAKEETGGQGAVIGAYAAQADYAVAVDVSFAKTPDADADKCGTLKKGAMIGYSPVLDKRMSDAMRRLAEEQGIPYQLEVMGGRSTGTNADGIFTARAGVRTGLISIPQRYMHTPAEVVAVEDIKAAGALLAAVIREAGAEHV